MQMYWSTKDIPELANLTPQQRQQAWKACYSKYAFKYWQTWVSLFVLGILVAVGIRFLGIIGGAIGGGLGGAVFGVVISNVLRPHLRDYVQKEFAQQEPV